MALETPVRTLRQPIATIATLVPVDHDARPSISELHRHSVSIFWSDPACDVKGSSLSPQIQACDAGDKFVSVECSAQRACVDVCFSTVTIP
jgi:hypothetical protein